MKKKTRAWVLKSRSVCRCQPITPDDALNGRKNKICNLATELPHCSYYESNPMNCCIAPNSIMNVTVVHGFSKIPLTIENYDEATVEHLLEQLVETSGVPKESQKLIFKVRNGTDLRYPS